MHSDRMSDSARDLLVRGVAAAKAGDADEARFYLEWVLRTEASAEQKAKAWLWLSQISDDPQAKRNCLEEALALDPTNPLARRGLAILEGRLDPDDIIDPNKPITPPAEGASPEPLATQRFVCEQCGGKMAFKAGGKAVVCEYCGHEMSLFKAMTSGAMVQEHDFTVAMATAKGHTRPVGVQPFICQGCGATFVVSQGTLSITCVYCGSAHVTQQKETRQLIPPEAVVPFAISHDEAQQAFLKWLKKKRLRVKVAPIRGLYLPAWTFDLSGEVKWQCFVQRDDRAGVEIGGFSLSVNAGGGGTQRMKKEGTHLVYEDDVLVPASHKLPADLLLAEAEHFILADAVPYDERYLADWPAEMYDITMSDASLVARRVVLERTRKFMRPRLDALLTNPQDIQLNTSGVIIESFKLVLLPVWVTRYRHKDKVYHAIINGQTGKVCAQEPQNRLQRFFRSLF